MTEIERDAMREARNAYRREWNRRNPDKVKAAQEKYWLKKAKEMGGAEGKGDNAEGGNDE